MKLTYFDGAHEYETDGERTFLVLAGQVRVLVENVSAGDSYLEVVA